MRPFQVSVVTARALRWYGQPAGAQRIRVWQSCRPLARAAAAYAQAHRSSVQGVCSVCASLYTCTRSHTRVSLYALASGRTGVPVICIARARARSRLCAALVHSHGSMVVRMQRNTVQRGGTHGSTMAAQHALTRRNALQQVGERYGTGFDDRFFVCFWVLVLTSIRAVLCKRTPGFSGAPHAASANGAKGPYAPPHGLRSPVREGAARCTQRRAATRGDALRHVAPRCKTLRHVATGLCAVVFYPIGAAMGVPQLKGITNKDGNE
jgi:hypothetical protein